MQRFALRSIVCNICSTTGHAVVQLLTPHANIFQSSQCQCDVSGRRMKSRWTQFWPHKIISGFIKQISLDIRFIHRQAHRKQPPFKTLVLNNDQVVKNAVWERPNSKILKHAIPCDEYENCFLTFNAQTSYKIALRNRLDWTHFWTCHAIHSSVLSKKTWRSRTTCSHPLSKKMVLDKCKRN